jgi:hypothetical protein
VAKNADNNRTKIAIENAKLTHEAINNMVQSNAPQPPAMPAQPPATAQPQGNQNVQ